MDVYEYITTEETRYQSQGVPVADGCMWSMFKHIKLSTLYKISQYETGKTDDKPYRNIIRPILNVEYRSEGFDVKDIDLYVNDAQNFYKSFLARKYHDRWARMNDMDTLIDEVVESYIDYGLGLVKDVNQKKPERVPMQRIAFCDQTDVLSGPICEKHSYSPDQMLDMDGRWDTDRIEEAIAVSEASKDNTQNQSQEAKTPGKYIEVYELHGNLPEEWLRGGDPTGKYVKQVHFVTFYKTTSGEKKGITLFKGPERKQRYKQIKRDAIWGRACGFGGIEELFEAQVWTNYSVIQIKEMLDVASMIIMQTASGAFANKTNVTELEKGAIVSNGGDPVTQVNMQPINIEAFRASFAEWEAHARTTGSAQDAQLGEAAKSGTPFALENLITATGQSLHKYRQGKISTFFTEIYRDWILDHVVEEMNQGDQWLDDLTMEEMQYISDQISTRQANRKAVQMVLDGKQPTQMEIDAYREQLKSDWLKGGNKKFIKIFKGEFSKIPMDVSINIAGKQKDLSKMTADLSSIFKQVFADPSVLQIPAMAKIFNQILEYSGFSMVDFLGLETVPPAQKDPQIAGGISGANGEAPVATPEVVAPIA
jgi:hypothetical protein